MIDPWFCIGVPCGDGLAYCHNSVLYQSHAVINVIPSSPFSSCISVKVPISSHNLKSFGSCGSWIFFFRFLFFSPRRCEPTRVTTNSPVQSTLDYLQCSSSRLNTQPAASGTLCWLLSSYHRDWACMIHAHWMQKYAS